ncbi:hypothetical protein VTL71DRAFT_10039 [Oculimacula yallundae]|uniref:Uncharacterized protein n=1 Tax=Oculimacula yallundae TaxID=86028 RepID=A0ABR4BS44_9HELO
MSYSDDDEKPPTKDFGIIGQDSSFQGLEDGPREEEQLKPNIRARHINVIDVAGTTGTDLFLSSGKTIAKGGFSAPARSCGKKKPWQQSDPTTARSRRVACFKRTPFNDEKRYLTSSKFLLDIATMIKFNLEEWVMEKYEEIGFGIEGGSLFIGKKRLKRELISMKPNYELRIQQLVNDIQIPDTLPANVRNPQLVIETPSILPHSHTSGHKHIVACQDTSTASRSGIDTPEASSSSAPANTEQDLQDAIEESLSFHSRLIELKSSSSSTDVIHIDLATSMSDLQLELLQSQLIDEEQKETVSLNDVVNATMFCGETLARFRTFGCPQYGLLGCVERTGSTTMRESTIYLNTNVPFSAFICGVQGSGKSHTTACMIENCLISAPVLGVLQRPLSVLVFNFAEYTSRASFRPCELAFLAAPDPNLPYHLGVKRVRVLVSPSNYQHLKKSYSQIPGVSVRPFLLAPKDLDICTILTLMSIKSNGAAPLYMATVTKILRKLAMESTGDFDYTCFRRLLRETKFDNTQREFLEQRLDLLDSFLDLDLDSSSATLEFNVGEITIVDLSCPFVDAATACILFKIAKDLFLKSNLATGKVIVLDEAHKYMTDSPASKALTESLMGVIREQRHYGVRVIISTQEPTISPKLIDICSITIMHRFSSPEWLSVLKKHILLPNSKLHQDNTSSMLSEIMNLKTGEAILFAPSTLFTARDGGEPTKDAEALSRFRVRRRITWDGGKSVVCV